jgi:hypothetical protein
MPIAKNIHAIGIKKNGSSRVPLGKTLLPIILNAIKHPNPITNGIKFKAYFFISLPP